MAHGMAHGAHGTHTSYPIHFPLSATDPRDPEPAVNDEGSRHWLEEVGCFVSSSDDLWWSSGGLLRVSIFSSRLPLEMLRPTGAASRPSLSSSLFVPLPPPHRSTAERTWTILRLTTSIYAVSLFAARQIYNDLDFLKHFGAVQFAWLLRACQFRRQFEFSSAPAGAQRKSWCTNVPACTVGRNEA